MAAAHSRRGRLLRSVAYVLAAILLVIAGLLAYLWFSPLGLEARQPAPVADYAQAADAIQRIAEAEGDAVNPLCRTRALDHGAKTAEVIVIFHGLSNCPQQFAAVADALYAQGYNVLLARLPRQGMADRLSEAPAQAKAEEAVVSAQDMIDSAHGLGEKVTVVGTSGGGAVAAWLAQHRPDVNRAVLISPFFGVQNFPANLTRPISTAVRLLPNWWGWFDPELKEKALGPQHGYPRFSSRTIAEYLRIAAEVTAAAKAQPPAVQDIRIIGNLNDETIRTEMYRDVAANWQAHGANIFLYEYPVAAGLKHDLIDPEQPAQQVDVVHPYVVSVITADQPAAP